MKLLEVLILLVSLISQGQSFNILILAPLASWSEYQLAKALAETLTGVGHQVTLATGYKPPKPSQVTEIFVGSLELEKLNIFEIDMLKIISFGIESQIKVCNMMYTNKDVLDIWKNRNNFDAIIGFSFTNDIIAPFIMDYHGTYIGLCTIGLEAFQISNQGNRLPRSVTPFIFSNYDENMNFMQRVLNILMEVLMVSLYKAVILPQVQTLLEKYFPGMPSVVDLYGNYSLLLINSHFAMDGVYPLLPNQVEIGTLAAKLPQPLPEDLRKFVNEAENGIIYFCLGSTAKSTDIPKIQMAMILEAFRNLPQRVVWKFEDDLIENISFNVFIRKWLPQQDILGHSKTLVFISHCGVFGTQEAKYYGVPVLGVPISFDQHRHAARLARKGYGRVLNWDDMTVELIIENINILIKDTSYRERINMVSKALQDQKESPKERAVWWIEYAIRHKGSRHLNYAGKNLNGIQYHMIDVWALLIFAMLLWISLSYLCLRKCFKFGLRNKFKYD